MAWPRQGAFLLFASFRNRRAYAPFCRRHVGRIFFEKETLLVLIIFQRKIIIRSEINPKNNILSESTKTLMSWAYDGND